ncbi:tRNA N6-adenosine(37)-N6-threonylcarbamoyltransferase complex dimerization subunit TsaB [Vibrio sp. UCD-FRSSP16_10]|uniref:tRNA (adenosine(37)-N6)-threonylcarbamoyltransferase complex dimerization subunit type 1 TsaB n=1 Tax=unclassified Vibrio TaxID=2614977 RepID=UPI0007FC9F9C|nr:MULTISPECIES: tRNA (adenosine(37)-N6)-threonylcarbamoyltransferase complex dimerization subunit type 1 TsaB [unclassified Vibrio]OBT08561.1 tRNA N6-adenosine(37)-N6-threonylcarbamoyltransferase complex dimerization subunit TsaB [Vibrio sp. UCD-FRSSP16_30]OBT18091.1 tRNA N6-adenosine(37)-N6-threonylcarbamoyltransferase complex dimerization subunit TsaB [Vibrio sp. UCD-FRSSP16_10]
MKAKILALDTSTEFCSAAIIIDGEILFKGEVAPREHTSKILPMVDQLLVDAGVKLTDLDALAFGRGPGSFTGVRIGIGIAQGLAFGADLPMLGVSTLQAMAQGAYRQNGSKHVAAAIDARMSEVYWGRFSRLESGLWHTEDQECVIAPQELLAQNIESDEQWAQVGTGWEAYADELNQLGLQRTQSGVLYPESQDIVVIAQHELEQGNQISAEQASPVYLRDKVAWKKLPGRE